MKRLLACIVFALAIQFPANAQENSCESGFTWLSRFIAKGGRAGAEKVKEIWREDYLAAWQAGRNFPGRAKKIFVRSLLAPRSRLKDQALREEELRQFQWLRLLDPFGEGILEAVSKSRIALGRPPLSRNLSIPAGIGWSAVTGSAMAYYVTQKQEKEIESSQQREALGIKYTMEMADLLGISHEDAIKLFNDHTGLIRQWLQELEIGIAAAEARGWAYHFLILAATGE